MSMLEKKISTSTHAAKAERRSLGAAGNIFAKHEMRASSLLENDGARSSLIAGESSRSMPFGSWSIALVTIVIARSSLRWRFHDAVRRVGDD